MDRSILFPAIMLLTFLTGMWLSQGRQRRLGLTPRQRIAVSLGAFCGGMIGSKIPFAFAHQDGPLCIQAWFGDGKTILFGLLGGYLGVELAKWISGVRSKTGDAFAIPVAVAVGIGRLGCFVGKCCTGLTTSLPWGVDFGDGILRHPTQIYEMIFHLSCAVFLLVLERRNLFPRQRLKLYLLAYCIYRIATEFIRPEIRMALGLTAYQWFALASIPAILWLWWWDSHFSPAFPQPEREAPPASGNENSAPPS